MRMPVRADKQGGRRVLGGLAGRLGPVHVDVDLRRAQARVAQRAVRRACDAAKVPR